MMNRPLKPLKPTAVVKSVGPKLVPFFKTVAIFFVLYGEESRSNSIFYCLFKCLPVVSLMIFVLLHGMNFTEVYAYSRKILIGLMFSILGDAFLVFKSQGYFLYGVAAFAMAQIMYSLAFGIRPLRLVVGLCCGLIGAMLYLFLLPGMDGVMTYAGAIYAALITTMLWRAAARVQIYNDLWVWTKLSSCLGAIAFVFSDFMICYDKFVGTVPYAHNIIMVSYYIAQMFITVSVVDSQADSLIKDDDDSDMKMQHVIEQSQKDVPNETPCISESSDSETDKESCAKKVL